MSRRCEICGKTSSTGNTIARSGSPKYKGGIGLHTGGVTKRRFYPNVQKIRVIVNGTVKRMRVCSRCLKAGKVQRPPARPSQLKAAAEAEARRIVEEAAEVARAAAEAEAASTTAEEDAQAAPDESSEVSPAETLEISPDEPVKESIDIPAPEQEK